MMPDGSFGTPYSVSEARGAANEHKDMDQYHQGLMLWLCDEVDRLNKLVPKKETTAEVWRDPSFTPRKGDKKLCTAAR